MELDNEPKALVADILSEIISYIKESRPTRTDGTSTQGYVYSQVRPGQMISPRDFAAPWSPIGGAGAAQAAAAAAQRADGPNDGSAQALASAAAARRALQAAFNTAQLVDTMMIVTNDGTMETFSGGGRHLSFAYPSILESMTAPAAQPRPENEQQRIDAATAVLYTSDGDDTPTYARFLANQLKFADARAQFVLEQNRILADPAQADSAGILLAPFVAKQEQAFNKWRSQGADDVEAALATLNSLGRPLEQGMIDRADANVKAWKVAIGGVGLETPYTYLLPSEWAALDIDDIGWTRIEKSASSYSSHFDSNGYGIRTGSWRGDSSQSSGTGGIGIFGFGFYGSHSEGDASASANFFQSSSDGQNFQDDAKNLSIDFEYGLVQIVRPWLTSDVFHMRNWWIENQEPGAISDGTINGQLGDATKLLPLIPTHLVCVRNVKITAENWGTVKSSLEKAWGQQRNNSASGGSATSGGATIPVFGIFSVSGGGSHTESHYEGSFTDEGGRSYSNDYGARFVGETLEIKGTQIVAWLSEIVPLAPPKKADSQ